MTRISRTSDVAPICPHCEKPQDSWQVLADDEECAEAICRDCRKSFKFAVKLQWITRAVEL